MTSYFKYTDGNAFTLNGEDYRGMLNVVDGTAFTGSIKDSSSRILSSKGTFYSGFFLNQQNYIDPPYTSLYNEISAINVYPRSILTINTLSEILETLNTNNIKIFKAGIRYNPTYFNLSYRDQTTLPATYCLSSSTSTLQSQRLPLHNIDLRNAGNNNLNALLNNYQNFGSLFVALSNNFKYYNNNFVISGTVNSLSSLSINTGLNSVDFTHQFLSYDRYNNLVYQNNGATYTIYSYDYDSPNNTMFIVDKIDMTAQSTTTNNNNSVYGRNYRSIIALSQGIFHIEIYSLRDSVLQKSVSPDMLNLTSISKIAQRFEDDILVVLGVRGDELILQSYDITNLLITGEKISEISLLTYDSLGVESIPTVIELSNFDSDVVMFKYLNSDSYLTSLQLRSLTTSKTPLVVYSVDNLSITNIQINSIFEQITKNIELCDEIAMGDDSLLDNISSILDIKFYPTDSLNIILISDKFIRTDNFSMLENIPPLSLKQNYVGYSTGDNSIGLTINSLFKSIIQDTVSLYYYFTEKFTPRLSNSNGALTIGINTPTFLNDLLIDDFYVYGNESMNVSVLNRVLKKIYDVQYYLANTIALNNPAS